MTATKTQIINSLRIFPKMIMVLDKNVKIDNEALTESSCFAIYIPSCKVCVINPYRTKGIITTIRTYFHEELHHLFNIFGFPTLFDRALDYINI